MTDPKSTTEDVNGSGKIRTGFAVISMIAMLSLGTAVTALAGGGGVGTGGGGGGGGEAVRRRPLRGRVGLLPAKDKKWAHKTSECESGPNEDPNIHSPGRDYHGAFQFLKSTWQAAPMSKGKDAHNYSWKVQAVVAVKWMHKAGKDQWPVCGH